jgi:hypothetical protein
MLINWDDVKAQMILEVRVLYWRAIVAREIRFMTTHGWAVRSGRDEEWVAGQVDSEIASSNIVGV